ncbi:NAD(P)-binding protein [Phanerochaete sordida]|uniref:NAD(P)-binding protein n=1 Tax=Phanerochaete sordida TaxID=48140 RepID=A0A9P3GCI6_9APHY|nr:NAD(P)-binding protein [Phanerochaete sordida]
MDSRVWVITGTNSGLGLAMALHALKCGDKVIATVRSADKFPDELREAGAHMLLLDLYDTDENIKATAERAIEVYGHIDVLVNNAGTNYIGYGPVEETSLAEVRQQFQLHLFGALAFTQPVLAHMRARRAGHVLLVSSVATGFAPAAWGAYSASKGALEQYADTLAHELAPFCVRVRCLVPGHFPTRFFVGHPRYAPDGAPPPPAPATAYTEPGQGFDSINAIPRLYAQNGWVGDPARLAARVFELVSGTGFAATVLEELDPEWTRVPCGTDSGTMLLKGYENLVQNIKRMEPLWKSTDVSAPVVD